MTCPTAKTPDGCRSPSCIPPRAIAGSGVVALANLHQPWVRFGHRLWHLSTDDDPVPDMFVVTGAADSGNVIASPRGAVGNVCRQGAAASGKDQFKDSRR